MLLKDDLVVENEWDLFYIFHSHSPKKRNVIGNGINNPILYPCLTHAEHMLFSSTRLRHVAFRGSFFIASFVRRTLTMKYIIAFLILSLCGWQESNAMPRAEDGREAR